MDNNVIKKRLNTFKSSTGSLRQISDDVIIDVLRAWENWPGTSAKLYRELGLSKMQLVTIIKKAKNLVKCGVVTEDEFKEITIDNSENENSRSSPCSIELVWDNNKVIRFAQVEQLVNFVKKVA